MTTGSAQVPTPLRGESPAEREAQIKRGREMIAKANADIDVGLGIEDEDMAVWLGLLDRGPHAPMSKPGRQLAVARLERTEPTTSPRRSGR